MIYSCYGYLRHSVSVFKCCYLQNVEEEIGINKKNLLAEFLILLHKINSAWIYHVDALNPLMTV
jgi:hypothetical protein